MASYGYKNWNRNWKGSDKQSVVKKSFSPYYKSNNNGTFTKIGSLVKGTPITYIDSETKNYTRCAIKLDESDEIYYINIDNLVKPILPNRSNLTLSPDSFGLHNQTFTSSANYYNSVINSLNNRNDIDGELFDFLHQLLDYAKNGTHDYKRIEMAGFPWGSIIKDFGEVLGPLVCIERNILANIIPTTGLSSGKIYFPPAREPIYDYKIISGGNEYLISAKSSKGITNQVKPQYIIPVVQGKLPQTLLSSNAYILLKILASYSIKQGPFYAWKLLQNTKDLTDDAIADMEMNYSPRNKLSTTKISDYEIWKPFLKKYFSGKKIVTYGQIRYKCEKLIESASKSGLLNINLKKIFNIYLNESRIIYVKFDLNTRTGVPSFTAVAGGNVSKVTRIYLRSSNSSENRLGDKIGFQIS